MINDHSLSERQNIDIYKMFSSELGRTIYSVVENTVNDFGMRDLMSEGIALGLSGGADSVLLLLTLLEYKRRNSDDFSIYPIHVNHCIRGDEADADERYCAELCNRLGLQFYSARVDIPTLAKRDGIGLEECARKVRYSILGEYANKLGCSCIAVAHNADDNAETLIFNLTRGSGAKGGCGIRPIRDNIIRPIIRLSKQDIISFLNICGIEYKTDSTNLCFDYTRNRIRGLVIPELAKINPDYTSAFARFSDSLAEDCRFLDDLARGYLDELRSQYSNGCISLDFLAKMPWPILSRLLTLFAEAELGISLENLHLMSIRSVICSRRGTVSLPGDNVFQACKARCYFLRTGREKISYYKSLNIGENYVGDIDAMIIVGDVMHDSYSNVYKFSIHTKISSDIIFNGLYLRSRQDGDQYKYDGITHRLKKVYNDRDISPLVRDFIPVICDRDGIVWVPGLKPVDGAIDSEDKMVDITFLYNKRYNVAK